MSIPRTHAEAVDDQMADTVVDEKESLVVSLFGKVAEAQDRPENPPLQLYDYVDPEALKELLAHAETRDQSEWELTFAVEDVEVTVTSDGEFTVE